MGEDSKKSDGAAPDSAEKAAEAYLLAWHKMLRNLWQHGTATPPKTDR